MKTRFPLRSGSPRSLGHVTRLAALFTGCALASDSTQELRVSLLARGDFNRDGRVDCALVDRETGILRVAYRAADGSLNWGEGHHTGISPATGVASGRMIATNRDAVAVTGTWANRTNVFDPVDPAVMPAPLSVFTPSTGPTGVSAVQVLNGAATLEEIVVHHTENGAPAQSRAFVRFTGSPLIPQAFTPSVGLTVTDPELRPRRLEGLGYSAFGSFSGGTFRVYRTSASPLGVVATLSGLPGNCEFVHADFDGAASTSPAQFLFYRRDETGMHRASLSAANTFSALAEQQAPSPIENITAVAASAGGWNLLVVYTAGWAQLFSWNGSTAPVPGESFPVPPEGVYHGVFAAGPGDFHLLAGPPGLSPVRAHRFTWNGSAHAPNGTSEIPPLRAGRATSNLFAFNKDPFIASDAVMLGSFSVGEWTREGTLSGSGMQVQQARFADETTGLGAFQTVNLGNAPAGTQHLLTNQIPSGQPGVPSYASAYGPAPALGRTLGEITIHPAPGRHLRAVRPSFVAPSGVSVSWRIGSGAWISLAAQQPGWQFDAFTIEWRGIDANGTTSPIRNARYTFAEPPSTMDSDGDGVPDYVEIALGLDPLGSGDDSDGDGASDLLEILSGTNPGNDADFPTRSGGPSGGANEFDRNYQNTFQFRITPVPVAGTTRYATSGAVGAGVALHDLPGLQLSYRPTVGSDPQHARIGDIQAGYGGTLLVAATDPNFDLRGQPPADPRRSGRELAGLIPVPVADLGPVPHDYTGGNPATAANAWIQAARAHYSQPTPPIAQTIDATTTLCLLLVELKYEQILRARGELGAGQTITLTPFRPTENPLPLEERAGAPADAVFRLSAVDLDRLRRYAGEVPAFTYTSGWKPADIHQAISNGLATPSAATTQLITLARELYYLSASANDASLPQFPSPLETLRRFLRTSRLPGDTDGDGIMDPGETDSYWGNLSLTPAQLSQATSALPTLLGLPPSRPTSTGVFVVDGATFDGPVPVVRSLSTLSPHVLLQANGEPWPLSQFAELITGAELAVTGFTDVESPHAPDAIEVISISLIRLPSGGSVDADYNLLGDDWEALFPGLSNSGPFGDSDGDGYSDLQEYLAGTDPTDSNATPPGEPVLLSIPVIEVSQTGSGFELAFDFPAEFADRIEFHLQESQDLTGGFSDTGVIVPHQGGGEHNVTLSPAGSRRFWRIRLGLK